MSMFVTFCVSSCSISSWTLQISKCIKILNLLAVLFSASSLVFMPSTLNFSPNPSTFFCLTPYKYSCGGGHPCLRLAFVVIYSCYAVFFFRSWPSFSWCLCSLTSAFLWLQFYAKTEAEGACSGVVEWLNLVHSVVLL